MCGICGQVRWDGQAPERALVENMCAAQEHRGPDSRGIHVDRVAALGIQRLRVIDLATGDQPIFNEDGSVAVVLNGEIYNFRELRARLEQAGHRFATESDTEVIVHLYEEEGSRCVSSLQGMFGLAIWDARRRRLVLARDRVGKKPLFYSLRDGTLSFASELRALLQDPEIPRDLDFEALDAYLALRWIPAPLCAFEAVRKLPPASTLTVEDGRIEIERYWELDYRRPPESEDEREIAEELRERVRAAVRRRMVSDVPLGAFLSGGIDSSAVVATMAEQSSQPVRTFSIGFASDRYDELSQARLIAKRFETDHEELVVTPDAVEILPRIVRQYGEPFADSSAIPSFYLAELARRRVTVALNGDGGDESFAGYSRYVANLALDRGSRLPRPLRSTFARLAGALPSSGQIQSTSSRLRRLAAAAALDAPQRHASYLTQLDRTERLSLYTQQMRERVGAAHAAENAIERRWCEATAGDPLGRMLYVDVGLLLPDDLLVKMDIATMAHSLEARSPLLDHELMEFAAALPSQSKVRGSQKKIALREAFRGAIPDQILDAPKQGFVVPMAEWLRGELKELSHDVLLDSTARERGYFAPDSVRELLDRHNSGTEDRSGAIWTLLVLELWHREIGPAPASGLSSRPRERSARAGHRPALIVEDRKAPSEMTRKTTPPTNFGGDHGGSNPPSFAPMRIEPNEGRQDEQSESHPPEDQVEQVGVLTAMRWHLRLVLIPVVLLTCIGLAVGLLRSPVYTATANLSVDFGAQTPSSLSGSVTAAQALADSYARAVLATPVVHQVALKTNSPAKAVADHVSATPIPDSTVVKVNGTANSEQKAIALTNISATALTRYIGGLNGTRSGSSPVLTQFEQAEGAYQDRLHHQEELSEQVEANPSDQESARELKRARVQTQVALLKKNSVAELYGASQQAYVAPLSFLSVASSASSDKTSRLELLGFIGLVAGLAIGAALATVEANRL